MVIFLEAWEEKSIYGPQEGIQEEERETSKIQKNVEPGGDRKKEDDNRDEWEKNKIYKEGRQRGRHKKYKIYLRFNLKRKEVNKT